MILYLVAIVFVVLVVFFLNNYKIKNPKYMLTQDTVETITFMSVIVVMIIATVGMIHLVHNSLEESQCKRYLSGKMAVEQNERNKEFLKSCEKFKNNT